MNGVEIVLGVNDDSPIVVVVNPPQEITLDVASAGPPGKDGPPGEQGVPGPAGSGYTYTQLTPSDSWVIVHGLGHAVTTSVFDLSGDPLECFPTYVDANTVRVDSAFPITGFAYSR